MGNEARSCWKNLRGKYECMPCYWRSWVCTHLTPSDAEGGLLLGVLTPWHIQYALHVIRVISQKCQVVEKQIL